MIVLNKIFPCKGNVVTYSTDNLASMDVNLSVFYDPEKYGDLNDDVCYLRFNTPDDERVLSFDLNRSNGLILRVESPNLLVSQMWAPLNMSKKSIEVGVPSFYIKGVKPDPKFTNDNILDVTSKPMIELYDNGVAFNIGFEGEEEKIVSPCEGVYFHLLEGGVLAKVSFLTKDQK